MDRKLQEVGATGRRLSRGGRGGSQVVTRWPVEGYTPTYACIARSDNPKTVSFCLTFSHFVSRIGALSDATPAPLVSASPCLPPPPTCPAPADTACAGLR